MNYRTGLHRLARHLISAGKQWVAPTKLQVVITIVIWQNRDIPANPIQQSNCDIYGNSLTYTFQFSWSNSWSHERFRSRRVDYQQVRWIENSTNSRDCSLVKNCAITIVNLLWQLWSSESSRQAVLQMSLLASCSPQSHVPETHSDFPMCDGPRTRISLDLSLDFRPRFTRHFVSSTTAEHRGVGRTWPRGYGDQ